VAGIKAIISTIHEKLPQTKVLLLGVFPREPRMRNGKPHTMPMEKIRVINRELPKLAEEGKVRYLDISNAFLVDGKVPKSTMPDGVHLSEQGYEMWAKAVAPVIEEMMK
jgi:lysophospholipase L1-like esterase